MHQPNSSWYQANLQSLSAQIDRLRQRLQQQIQSLDPATPPTRAPRYPQGVAPPAIVENAPFALDQLQQIFGLSPFEQDLLLLCAAVELEADFATLCASAGNSQHPYVTLSLALALSSQPDWAALSPDRPLRRWKLIELGAGNAFTHSPVRIDEQILHYLLGNRHLNELLMGMATPLIAPASLVPSHQHLAQEAADTWYAVSQAQETLPVLQFCGSDLSNQRSIAALACTSLNLTPYTVSANLLPIDLTNLDTIKCLWEREYLLNQTAWIVEWLETSAHEPKLDEAIAHLLETLAAPVMVLSRDRRRQNSRPFVTFLVTPPTATEQQQLWQQSLGKTAPDLEQSLNYLISYFNLSAPTIRTLGSKIQQLQNQPPDKQPLSTALWNLCRTQARPRLDELADRIESSVGWDDLVLPEVELQVLHSISLQLRQRIKVYQEWGFGKKSQRGLGISALFAGSSGTGKTMAAEVVANELQLDLYRIDLSAVVSKYIGETEKNLGRVFDAAETGGVILLFDEADSLFGKRSEVKDSHDRHANMEINYLLQRMEDYRGLSILTTNLKGAIDQAFMRRIRFILNFPFPDAVQRAEIWRRIFPAETPTLELDPVKLGKLSVAGGNIRSIALNAAFLAAEANEDLQMKHILEAARSEHIKMEKPFTDVGVKGWV
jgi:ATPase family associated with various cellular activities (AAA)